MPVILALTHRQVNAQGLLQEVHAAEEGLEAGVAVGWSPAQLSQLGVFSFGFLKDGDVGVGVFPQGEEVLVSAAGASGVTR